MSVLTLFCRVTALALILVSYAEMLVPLLPKDRVPGFLTMLGLPFTTMMILAFTGIIMLAVISSMQRRREGFVELLVPSCVLTISLLASLYVVSVGLGTDTTLEGVVRQEEWSDALSLQFNTLPILDILSYALIVCVGANTLFRSAGDRLRLRLFAAPLLMLNLVIAGGHLLGRPEITTLPFAWAEPTGLLLSMLLVVCGFNLLLSSLLSPEESLA